MVYKYKYKYKIKTYNAPYVTRVIRRRGYHFRLHRVTSNPGFKVTVYLKVEYLKKVRFRDKVTKERP